ncbi:MAG: SEC-C metal-binding domain-containing protein, partial [Thiohalocapsa sp.]
IRKQLLTSDDVMNDQRKVVYEQRRDIMMADDVAATVADMRNDSIASTVAAAIPPNALPEQWDIPALHAECLRLVALDLPLAEWAQEEGIDSETIEERIAAAAEQHMAEKAANVGPELMRMAEKSLLLQLLDQTWKDHLLSLDHLRQGINLRAYGQRDPLNEYKREAFELFEGMLINLREQVTSVLSHVELRMAPPEPPSGLPPAEYSFGEPGPFDSGIMAEPVDREPALVEAGPAQRRSRPARGNGRDDAAERRAGPAAAAARAPWAGTGRNAPCPCGSGKKFKHCHGRL